MSKARGSVRFKAVVLIALGTAALVACVAAAANVVGKNFTVKALETANHSVRCAKTQLATSGGFKIDDVSNETSVEVQGSRPAGRKWVLNDRNVGHQDFSGKLLTLCAKDKGLVVRSKAHTTAPTDTDVQVNARCPKGSKAIGGGGRVTTAGSPTELGSFPAGDGRTWGTRWSLPGDAAVGLEAYAVCDKRIRGYSIVEATGTVPPPFKRVFVGSASAVAKCEGTDELAGGGWFHLDPQTWWTRIGPKGQGWEATGNTYSNSPSPVLSFAICGK